MTDRLTECQHADAIMLGASCPRRYWGPATPPNHLAVITCHFNPCGYRRPRENYDRFAAGMVAAGAELFTVEVAYDDDPFDLPAAQLRIRGRRDQHLLWQKERLLNLAIAALPADVDAIAWIDADILFAAADWLPATLDALSRFQVVQPWRQAVLLGHDGREVMRKISSGWLYHHERAQHLKFHMAHPGYAWAARSDWLRQWGLYESNVTGGSDSCMMGGFSPDSEQWIRSQINDEWYSHCRAWCDGVQSNVRGSFGYVNQTITHLYHGERRNRQYVSRWRCLTQHRFDPLRHLTIDDTGLLTWTDEAIATKPDMVRQVADYFAARREDD